MISDRYCLRVLLFTKIKEMKITIKEFVELTKKEIERLLTYLPDAFALVFSTIFLVDLKKWVEKGGKLGRLKINRIPKQKFINALAESIKKFGIQTMGIVITARQAIEAGYEITDFDYNTIPEEEYDDYLIIPDGQTRRGAIEKIKNECPSTGYPNYYAHFPLNCETDLTDVLQTININRFNWTNSDYFTGNSSDSFTFIKDLESKGYNYTAACEWARLQPGIINKRPLLNLMKDSKTKYAIDNFKYGERLYKKASLKFSGDKEIALKTKTVPEFIISKWSYVSDILNKEEATQCLEKFIEEMKEAECKEVVNPKGYKRGCKKKKEDFVNEQLEKSFTDFESKFPRDSFKS